MARKRKTWHQGAGDSVVITPSRRWRPAPGRDAHLGSPSIALRSLGPASGRCRGGWSGARSPSSRHLAGWPPRPCGVSGSLSLRALSLVSTSRRSATISSSSRRSRHCRRSISVRISRAASRSSAEGHRGESIATDLRSWAMWVGSRSTTRTLAEHAFGLLFGCRFLDRPKPAFELHPVSLRVFQRVEDSGGSLLLLQLPNGVPPLGPFD